MLLLAGSRCQTDASNQAAEQPRQRVTMCPHRASIDPESMCSPLLASVRDQARSRGERAGSRGEAGRQSRWLRRRAPADSSPLPAAPLPATSSSSPASSDLGQGERQGALRLGSGQASPRPTTLPRGWGRRPPSIDLEGSSVDLHRSPFVPHPPSAVAFAGSGLGWGGGPVGDEAAEAARDALLAEQYHGVKQWWGNTLAGQRHAGGVDEQRGLYARLVG